MEEDYKNNYFGNYDRYETSYGVVLGNVEQAMEFNNVHEGMHLGYMIALNKVIAHTS